MNTIINTNHILSRREETALLLVAQGKVVRDAARVMHISGATAYEHINNAKNKLHAETLPHAVSLLWGHGYLHSTGKTNTVATRRSISNTRTRADRRIGARRKTTQQRTYKEA